jgi:hypothetical protein
LPTLHCPCPDTVRQLAIIVTAKIPKKILRAAQLLEFGIRIPAGRFSGLQFWDRLVWVEPARLWRLDFMVFPQIEICFAFQPCKPINYLAHNVRLLMKWKRNRRSARFGLVKKRRKDKHPSFRLPSYSFQKK